MKKITTLYALFITLFTFAQVPQGISYQAIAINGSGNPVVSSNVGIRLSVLDTSATGTVLYTETQTKTTNAQGLFNLVIGQGTVVSGVFSAINWSTNSKFLKVEMDVAGGTNYVLVGSTQLLSVPYAMHAASVSSIPESALNGIGTSSLKSSSFVVVDDNSVKGFYNGVWSTQNFVNFITAGDVIESNGNFAITDDNSVKAFCNGIWSTQNFTNFIIPGDIIASNGSFAITDDNSVKGLYNGTWSTQNFINFISSTDIIGSNGNFVVVDDNSVKGFYNGVWSTQNFVNFITAGDVIQSNGKFLITDDNSVKAFSNGIWSSQAFTNFISPSDIIGSAKN
jgi:hypothetical protein